jgi:EAL domain-containing protein (putative c-di-GMP-specific phosphodiesterase class I)
MSLINDWHFYSKDLGFVRQANPELVKNRKRHNKIIKLVREAIDNDDIEMYYQPIYEFKTKKFSNFEALVRLKDNKTYGYISPEEFIPLAEKHGLIMRLSERIFNKVFDFVASNNLGDKGISHMEVNLSGLQSVDAALPEQMSQLLKKYDLNPNIENLEITESIAITSSFMLKKNMDELKKIGCTFSMDDFGTGYSNLSQMAKIDYELIKIDKSLLWPCFDKNNPVQANAKIILDNMITMILSLGRKIVVEGVETKEQLDYLEKMGVTYIQGFYFSKPLPAADYIKFLEENN